MGLLDDINQMQTQGLQENDIIAKLQGQGISPVAINEALNQTKIKNAIQQGTNQMNEEMQPIMPSSNLPPRFPKTQEMLEEAPVNNQEYNAPQPQEEYYADQGQNYGGDYNGYSEEYDGYDTGDIGGSTTNFIEIAEQVFSEKIKNLQKEIQEMNNFKALSEVKIDQALERIKRIENVMDKLQMAIIEKVGSYGNTLQSIKKEMTMMQDSFGKMSPSLVQKHHATQTHHVKPKKSVIKKKPVKKK